MGVVRDICRTAIAVVACAAALGGGSGAWAAENLRVEVVARHPHQTDRTVSGLFWHNGMLYESAVLQGSPSEFRMVDPASGGVLQVVELPELMVGAGATVANGVFVQATLRDGIALLYDPDTLRRTRQIGYEGQVWGMAFDGKHLLTTDGTSSLAFRDPATMAPVTTRTVTLLGSPHDYLNELEFVDGMLYAAVRGQDRILRIDPSTGEVTGIVSASGLMTPEERAGAGMLNGIAHDPARGVFLITGSRWPWVYEVRFVPAP